MPEKGSDPVEERDIQKILGSLDDPRVVEKIAGVLAIKKTDISVPDLNKGVQKTETAFQIVSKLKQENQP